jgi:hypothetical protein
MPERSPAVNATVRALWHKAARRLEPAKRQPMPNGAPPPMSNDHPDFQRRERRVPAPGLSLAIGAGSAQRVEVAILGYADPKSQAPYDADWLMVEVEIAAGVFAGRFAASFEAGAFERFRADLTQVHATLAGEAAFETIEAQLTLRLVGNGRGQVALTGTAQHPLGDGNRLTFAFALDQTQLVEPLRQLEHITHAFPRRA